MKKLFVIAVAMMAVFGFSVGAFAGEVCTTCKCPIGNVPCDPGSTGQDGVTPSCPYFDYESRAGYCYTTSSQSGIQESLRNCKVLFNVCECPDPDEFSSGATIGIRMTLLVDGQDGENGAYWTNPDTTNVIILEEFETEVDACAADTQPDTFGDVEYFSKDGTSKTPAGMGTVDCVIPVANQASVLCSVAGAGYQVDEANVTNKEHIWWIDIPYYRIDPNVLHNNELISVHIELLGDTTGGICSSCDVICECVFDLAYVCCIPGTSSSCIYYPYVLQQETGWTTGIALTNLDFTGASWSPSIVFTDADGTAFTATPTYTKGTVAFSVDGLVTDEGWSPAAGAGWLQVTLLDAMVDGYQYNMSLTNNLMFGAGVLPRPCGFPCPCK